MAQNKIIKKQNKTKTSNNIINKKKAPIFTEYLAKLTFVGSVAVHVNLLSGGRCQHDSGNPIVAQTVTPVAVPLISRFGQHKASMVEERAVLVNKHDFLLGVTRHVYTVSRVDFAKGRMVAWSLQMICCNKTSTNSGRFTYL